MNAPPARLSPEAFAEHFNKHAQEHYEADDNGHYKCKKCGARILQTTCYVSIHTTLFSGCAGSGRCKQVPLPYCPTCEGVPTQTSTCVHTPDD